MEGIDVSRYQPVVDWNRVKADGIQFAYAQASLGDSFPEPAFDSQWNGMKAAGIPRGAYHFYIAGDDGNQQADNFLGKLNGDFGQLPAMVDLEGSKTGRTGAFETGSNASSTLVVAEITALLDAIEKATGKKPIIYTNVGFANNYLVNSDFSNYPLWIAQYPDPPLPDNPTLPPTWNNWTIWQYTDSGRVAGIPGNVDRDRFNGTLEEFLNMK